MVDEEKVVVPDELPEDEAELEALAEAGEFGVIEAPEATEPEAEETSPLEPDESLDEEEEMPKNDPLGIVTRLSEAKFKKLRSAWGREGKPNRLSALGTVWLVVDNGAKFVDKGKSGAMGDYGSLSTG